jgi:glyceraldehyde 3-phosphate dehydrogenase
LAAVWCVCWRANTRGIVCLIEEPAEPEAVEYLLRFDTLLGRFPGEIVAQRGRARDRRSASRVARAGGRRRAALGRAGDRRGRRGLGPERSATSSSAIWRPEPSASCSARRSPEPPDLTWVAGVTDDRLAADHRLVSMGSVTANAAGPVLRVLAHALGVERAFLSTVHAYTSQLRLADVPAPDMRSGRAAAENIIPQPTNADEVLSELLPELAGRISGLALHVPVPNGSVVDLTCWHPRAVTAETSTPPSPPPAPATSPASSPTRRSRSSPPTS